MGRVPIKTTLPGLPAWDRSECPVYLASSRLFVIGNPTDQALFTCLQSSSSSPCMSAMRLQPVAAPLLAGAPSVCS